MTARITRIGDLLARAQWLAIGLLLAALTCVTILQVISRNAGIYISWVEDVAMLLLVWMVFIGSALAVRYGGHYTVDVYGTLPAVLDRALRILSVLTVFIVLIVFFWKGIELGWRLRFRLSGAAEIPMYAVYAAFPLSSLLAGFHLIEATLTRPQLPDAQDL